MNVVVRRLNPGDEVRAAEAAAMFKSAQIAPARAGRLLSNPSNYLIVAEKDGALAGFVLAYRLDRLDRDVGQLFVYEVGVRSEHRRSRIGTRLMRFVRQIVAEESLTEAFVLTDHDNEAAVRLYRGTGGQVEGSGSVLFVYPGYTA